MKSNVQALLRHLHVEFALGPKHSHHFKAEGYKLALLLYWGPNDVSTTLIAIQNEKFRSIERKIMVAIELLQERKKKKYPDHKGRPTSYGFYVINAKKRDWSPMVTFPLVPSSD
jgi:hypothetical protein